MRISWPGSGCPQATIASALRVVAAAGAALPLGGEPCALARDRPAAPRPSGGNARSSAALGEPVHRCERPRVEAVAREALGEALHRVGD